MVGSVKRHLKMWLAITLVLAYAVVSDLAQGNPPASVQLNDASVWVTRSANGDVARLNHQIAQLDARVVPGATPDVVQEGTTVYSQTTTTPPQLRSVDVAHATLGRAVGLPVGSQVSLGGKTLAIRSGIDLWVLPSSAAAQFNAKRPTYTGLGGTQGHLATAGQDGVVHAYSLSNHMLTDLTLQADGQVATQSRQVAIGSGSGAKDIVVSAVGSIPVVLDQDAHTVTVAGHSPVSIPTAPVQTSYTGTSDPGAVQIQQPGPDNGVVYVASTSGLYAVPLSGGPASRVSSGKEVSGDPVAPVFNNGCVHTAWASSHNYLLSCTGGTPAWYDITNLTVAGNKLVFRVNGSVVVLNDAVHGQVWVVHNGLQQVADWATFEKELNPEHKNQPGTGPADTSQSNQPPKANDVTFGVRPNRTSLLPVTLFDSDPNNYVLTLTGPTSLPASEGTLQIVNNGTMFQFTPAAGVAPGTPLPSIPYTVSDGAGVNDTATAQMNITVVAASTETAPKRQGGTTAYDVLQGATIRFDALGSWWDPEGDPFGLVAAEVPADSGDQVTFTPSGQVSFRAGGAPGPQQVKLTVSDGTKSATEQVTVTVNPPGQPKPPHATPFLATATAGRSTVLQPLSVDSDPNDYPMTLASVTAGNTASASGADGLVWTPDYTAGTINFQAAKPGTYYLTYQATDNPPQGVGQPSDKTSIRVDVSDPKAPGPPVAMAQVAHLGPGGSVLLPVLRGSSSPAGSILVVQSVTTPVGSPVEASVYQGTQVRLSATSTLSGPQLLSYTVSDGTQQASAPIVVLPVPATSSAPLPPVAEPCSAKAVFGDIASIDPLVNDFDPQGGVLTITPGSVIVDEKASQFPKGTHGVGTAFIDGKVVRYLPPDASGQAVITYGVTSSSGQTASSSITVTVSTAQGDNSPPVPKPLVASVIAGSTVEIKVPLTGIDPMGESVTVVGLTPNPDFSSDPSFPQKGQIVRVNPDSLLYQSYPNSHGTDTFYYAVRNRSGLTGVGSVRVGIAPPAPIDAPPVAVPQTVSAPPGRTITVPVLEHDFDPQGYDLSFGPQSELKANGTGAVMVGSSLQVTVPGSGRAVVIYPVTDGHGASATGTLTVIADPSARQLPVPHDIVVSTLTTASAASVPVDILGHVTNPYGSTSPVTVVEDGFVGSSAGKPTSMGAGVYSVPLADHPQVIGYTVEGKDGQASATITVPARNDDIPQLVSPLPAISTPASQPVTVSIGTYVKDPAGKPLRIVTSAQVQAANGQASTLSPTSVTFTPSPGYVGPAALCITVTNGAAGDTVAPSVTFTLPITVTGDAPVQFYGPTVTAEAGKPASFVLTPYIASPNAGGVSGVKLSGLKAVAGLGAQINGQTLTVQPQGIVPPAPEVVTFTLVQGGSTPVTGEVDVLVQSSLAPLARTVPQTTSVDQGKTVQIDVLAQDFDPFPTPLVISAPVVVGGPDQGTVTTNGSSLSFTAAAHFFGVATVEYTVTDQTKLPSRQVKGTVAVTVFGVPDAPGSPSVLNYIGNGQVLLSWSSPPDNGKPITKYTVASTPASAGCTTAGPTTCTVNSLTNGTPYTFNVTATNAVGDGPASQPSSPVTPNNYPEQPAQPTTVFGDKSVTVNWTAPADQGTPITCYLLQISPPVAPATDCQPPASTSYVWPGLTNGSSYSFEVRAVNVLGPSPWSPLSASVVPAGKPAVPGQPTVKAVANDLTGQKVAVQWPAVTGAGANGDPVSGYSIATYQDATQVGTAVTVTPTSATQDPITYLATGLTNGLAYTFTVIATNKAGPSAASTASASFTVYGAPGPITDLKAASLQNGQTTLTFSQPASNGSAVVGYQVSVNSGGFIPLATNNVVSGLVNGTSYTFTVKGCNVNCSSTPSNLATAVPDTPPTVAVSMSAGGATGNTFTLTWEAPVASGPACAFTQPGAQEGYGTGSGGPWTYSTPGTKGSYSFTGPYNVTQTLYVLAKDGCGLASVAGVNAIANHTAYSYNNDNGGAVTGQAMCRGNPNYSLGHDMPGGSFSQTLSVPSGVGTINSVNIQVDSGATQVTSLNLSVNGSVRASGQITGTSGGTWSFYDVAVSAGDGVTVSGSLSDPGDVASGQIATIYSQGSPGGTFSWSNSCVQDNQSGSTGSTGLKMRVSGWGA